MGVVEEQYIFLKRVCQVLVHLGTSQLAPLWVSYMHGRREGGEKWVEELGDGHVYLLGIVLSIRILTALRDPMALSCTCRLS